MANPEHIPNMDALDNASVQLYRSGLALAALSLIGASVSLVLAPQYAPLCWVAVTAGAGLSVANMHLYAKLIRWIIGAAGWTGVVLMLLAAQQEPVAERWIGFAGLGFIFVALSAFALKEQFCFRIPLLRAVPVFLASALLPLVLDRGMLAAPLLALAGAVLAVLAYQKTRMPLHFDIGDKSAYQI